MQCWVSVFHLKFGCGVCFLLRFNSQCSSLSLASHPITKLHAASRAAPAAAAASLSVCLFVLWHQSHSKVEADIAPFRALLLGMFFMTVGFEIDLALCFNNLPLVASLVSSIRYYCSLGRCSRGGGSLSGVLCRSVPLCYPCCRSSRQSCSFSTARDESLLVSMMRVLGFGHEGIQNDKLAAHRFLPAEWYMTRPVRQTRLAVPYTGSFQSAVSHENSSPRDARAACASGWLLEFL